MIYRDISFCSSPACEGRCGRFLSAEDRASIPEGELIPMTPFCDEKGGYTDPDLESYGL